jgi:hypothetical protein
MAIIYLWPSYYSNWAIRHLMRSLPTSPIRPVLVPLVFWLPKTSTPTVMETSWAQTAQTHFRLTLMSQTVAWRTGVLGICKSMPRADPAMGYIHIPIQVSQGRNLTLATRPVQSTMTTPTAALGLTARQTRAIPVNIRSRQSQYVLMLTVTVCLETALPPWVIILTCHAC